MYDFLSYLVWRLNLILGVLAVFLAGFVLAYTSHKWSVERRRRRMMVSLRQKVEDPEVPPEEVIGDICPPRIDAAVLGRLVDILRSRELDLPDRHIQALRECFASPEEEARVERAALEGPSKWQRIQAVIILGYIQTASAVDILKVCLREEDEDVCYFAMLALGRIGTPDAAGVLLDFIGRGIFSGQKVVSILAGFPSTIVPVVVNALRDYNPVVRFWAVKLLNRFGPRAYLSAVESMAADRSSDVRAAVCQYLGEHGTTQSSRVLIERLNDPVWFVRMHAVRATGRVMGMNAVPRVVSLFQDEAMPVRESVKSVIVPHMENAFPYLERFVYGEDETARRDAIDVLVESGYVTRLMSQVLSDDPAARRRATELLRAMLESGIFFGLRRVLSGFPEEQQEKISEVLYA
jgi:HEAT repeat protein